ncbi:MAG TPA: SulP family inorganic anion transporter [Sphingobium sp.]|uniref:SulP family inorganic anion transporter n=1 Tax=Sphingobium sp. TaxID=1912891 RepID=UPI002ED0659E
MADEIMTAQSSSRSIRHSLRDPVAGLVGAIVALPDGLAAAAMVGVNPVFGLYASAVGPLAGGALTSTRLMFVAATSASAVATAEALADFPTGQRAEALMVLVILTGGFLLLLSLLRAGRLVRFVSHAVMTGFMLGVAVTLILAQLPSFFGFQLRSPVGGWLLHGSTNPSPLISHTSIVGVTALAIILLLRRTRLSLCAPLLALVLPTLMTILLGWSDVAIVASKGEIAGGIPFPRLPHLDILTPGLAVSAFAIAVIIAIQAAGISEGLATTAGPRPNISRDMLAQGVANCVSGILSGITVGGSIGQTALNVSIGAVTRWACISAGLWMLLFILFVPHLVAMVPMTALATLMIGAGFAAIDWKEALSIWRVGGSARLAITVTFLGCLFISVPAGVGVGVIVTIFYFVFSSATDVSLRMLVWQPNGEVQEQPTPTTLHSYEVVVLEVWGSLFFAGARTLQDRLPDPGNAKACVVILTLRGYSSVGATLIEVLDDYARRLTATSGRLYLSGISDVVTRQLQRSGKLTSSDNVHILPAQKAIGAATKAAIVQAQQWIAEQKPPSL